VPSEREGRSELQGKWARGRLTESAQQPLAMRLHSQHPSPPGVPASSAPARLMQAGRRMLLLPSGTGACKPVRPFACARADGGCHPRGGSGALHGRRKRCGRLAGHLAARHLQLHARWACARDRVSKVHGRAGCVRARAPLAQAWACWRPCLLVH